VSSIEKGHGVARILRRPLITLLDHSEQFPLTLLIAPAGSGKSTLLHHWESLFPTRRIVRLALDERDNDPPRFFRRLAEALRSALPGFDITWYDPFLREFRPSGSSIAGPLVDAFIQVEGDLHLVLDDFQYIDAPSIIDVFTTLLDDAPARLHLVLATRNYPGFPLTRIKLADKLLVIDSHDLKVTAEEVHHLNTGLGGPALSAENAAHIIAMTEGWLTGVKIALLAALESGPEALQGFSGTQVEVVEYFGHVVLKGLPESLRNLFLQSSIFERFDGALCDEVLQRSQSALLLEEVAERELFMLPAEGRRGWFRYHALLHDFLQNRLKIEQPEMLEPLHRRAAQYFLANDEQEQALMHAERSGDTDLFTRTLERCFDEWIRYGHFGEILKWSDRLRDDLIHGNFDLAAPLICGLTLSRRFHHARYYLDELKLSPEVEPSGRYADAYTCTFLELHLQLFQHDTDFFQDADLELLLQSSGHRDIRAFSLAMIAYYHLQHARLDLALQLASQARTVLQKLGHHFLASYAGLIIALCHRQNNCLVEAMQCVEAPFEETPRLSPSWTLWATGKLVILYEQNRLDEARLLCEELLPLVNVASATEVITTVYLTLSRLQHHFGDFVSARRLLDKLSNILKLGNYERFVSQVAHESMRQAVEMGDEARIASLAEQYQLAEVVRQSAENVPTYSERRERYGLAAVYWLTYQSQFSEAERLLETLISELNRAGIRNRALVSEANLLILKFRDESGPERMSALKGLLGRYELYNFSRSIFDEAPGLSQLFRDACQSGLLRPPEAYLERFQSIINQDHAPATTPTDPRLVLTNRELEIFNCLLRGLANAEISRLTGTSLTTTKWHLKNIYNKLGVSNRTEAVLTMSPNLSLTP
tara:strand:- start:8116 stop:10758 length:2643 start_codon:yes stop_codon:yes gene_type:complete